MLPEADEHLSANGEHAAAELPLGQLLPLRAMVVTLRFIGPARPRFFHQAALSAFIRHLLGSPDNFDTQLVIDTPECGRTHYREGDYYRFSVIALAGSENLLAQLIARLQQLPFAINNSAVSKSTANKSATNPRSRAAKSSAAKLPKQVPFRDNLSLVTLHDAFNEQPIQEWDELCAYGAAELEQEASIWQQQQQLNWHWLAPSRLLKDKQKQEKTKGEDRYCRDLNHLTAELLLTRLYDSLAGVLRNRGTKPPPRPPAPKASITSGHSFWLDTQYTDQHRQNHVMGGMLGFVQLHLPEPLTLPWAKLLVMGQFLGMGQRRAFGFGRYELVTQDGGVTYRRGLPASPLVTRVIGQENLLRAFQHVNSQRQSRENSPENTPKNTLQNTHTADDTNRDDESTTVEEFTSLKEAEQSALADNLDWYITEYSTNSADSNNSPIDDPQFATLTRLGDKLLDQTYTTPSLFGCTIAKKNNGQHTGEQRELSIPPFWDRVLQRAVAQVLTPALEQIMSAHSHGYRPGRSRLNARDAIQHAWRQGYHWVFEADIASFFTSVSWQRVHQRLRSLYYDDPLIEQIMAWVQAPVEKNGMLEQRHQGLPQGSPISPLLANLLLDDFDNDLQAAGFKLIRYADDFVVMCKSQAKAQAAEEKVRASLREHELELHPAKTRIVNAKDGFYFLGYLFINDLAIEASGQHSDSDTSLGANQTLPTHKQLSSKNTPPHPSFEQTATAISALEHPIIKTSFTQNPAAESEPEQQNQHTHAKIGQRDEQGTLVCVTGASALVASREGRIYIERDGNTLTSTPWSGAQALLLFGPHHITTPAIRSALQEQVPVHFCNAQGYYQGTTWAGEPAAAGHQQWLTQINRAQDQTACLYLGKCLTQARIDAQAELLRQRQLPDWRAVKAITEKLAGCSSLAELNGAEGNAARIFFASLASSLAPEWHFSGRNRRPPKDPVNVLLSLGYSLLYAYSDTLIRVNGLLPWQGFYHQPRGRHAALASDLMEPFRQIVERVALSQINLKALTPKDFTTQADGSCRISGAAKKQYIAALLKRFHEPRNATASLPQLLNNQAKSLLAWLTTDEPFTPGGQ